MQLLNLASTKSIFVDVWGIAMFRLWKNACETHIVSECDTQKMLRDGESNPGLPRDRRGYSPLYYRGVYKTLVWTWSDFLLLMMYCLWGTVCMNIPHTPYLLIELDYFGTENRLIESETLTLCQIFMNSTTIIIIWNWSY